MHWNWDLFEIGRDGGVRSKEKRRGKKKKKKKNWGIRRGLCISIVVYKRRRKPRKNKKRKRKGRAKEKKTWPNVKKIQKGKGKERKRKEKKRKGIEKEKKRKTNEKGLWSYQISVHKVILYLSIRRMHLVFPIIWMVSMF